MSIEEGLNRLADGYRDQGYDVTVRPGPDRLPEFAKGFRIEIVGRRGREGILVSVKRNRDELVADGDVPLYAELTAAQPDWRFDLAVLEGEDPNARDLKGAREFSAADIAAALVQAGELDRLGFSQAAILQAWAAFEAAMRARLRVLGQKPGWGSTPRQLVRELYSAGELAPEEFRGVESASRLRNQIVHGFKPGSAETTDPSGVVVRLLSELTRRLVSESQLIPQPV